LVELTGALLSLLVFLTHSTLVGYAFWLVVWMVLLFIVVYDLRHTIIPWSASLSLLALSIISLFVSFDTMPVFLFTPNIWSVAAGPILASPLVLLSLVSKGRWMGWGDGPLELSLGFLLGLSAGGTALMLAFWIGAAVGILLMVFKKGLTMKSELPFAPFLVAGALVVHFFHVDFFSTLPFLW
jgi:leader peptidase (prepilin peptidase)/N-methyltransferase